MKKLMIAVAIVCATAISQAASVTWNSSTGSANTFLVDNSGSQITALPTGTSLVLVALTGADLTAYQAGTYTGTYDASKVLNTGSISTSTKAAKKGQGLGSLSFVYSAGANPIKDGDVLAVLITDGKNVSNVSYYDKANGMVTDTLTVTGLDEKAGAPGDQNLYAGTLNWATKGNFVGTVNVPEPTSGLLLLLGMAGLALRRRRA